MGLWHVFLTRSCKYKEICLGLNHKVETGMKDARPGKNLRPFINSC